MTQLRLLLLITNLGKGGAQRVFYDHALSLKKSFYVAEAVFDVEHDIRLYDSGNVLHDLRRTDWLSRVGALGRLFSRAKALRELVARERYDVVISHLDGANWVNVLSGSCAKKIVVLHGSVRFDQGQTWIRQWIRTHIISRLIYDRAESTVSVSEALTRELTNNCKLRNVSTIKNFFDLNSIKLFSEEHLTESEVALFATGNVLLTSGRLTLGKRQSELLKMVAEMKSRRLSIRLIVLGDGECREDLVGLSRKLGLKTFDIWNTEGDFRLDLDVYFLGYVSNPYKYLKQATIFLFPSAWEGFPLALCEAIICGSAVVSSDCPTGPREILAPGTARDSYDLREAEFTENGVLMPMIESTDDFQVWVDTLQKLLIDKDKLKRVSSNATQMMNSLDRDLIIRQWQLLIERTANGN